MSAGAANGNSLRVIALTAEPISAEVLHEALGDRVEDSEVTVVAPALNDSSWRFWTSDSDAAIEHAEDVQEESVDRLDEEGIDAAGATGESDPLLAAEDAVALNDVDVVVVFSHPEGERAYLEEDRIADFEQRLPVPVIHRIVTRGGDDS